VSYPGDKHLVAFLQDSSFRAGRNQVDSFGAATHKDDFILRNIELIGHELAGAFELLRWGPCSSGGSRVAWHTALGRAVASASLGYVACGRKRQYQGKSMGGRSLTDAAPGSLGGRGLRRRQETEFL
jgi:hypothetical protein